MINLFVHAIVEQRSQLLDYRLYIKSVNSATKQSSRQDK